MRFIVDESTGMAVVRFLRGLGYDVIAVSETMPQAKDIDILGKAFEEKRILITNDKDFGELIYRGQHLCYGVLLLRLRDESPANRVRVVRNVVKHYLERLPGNFIVVMDIGIRVRPLPKF